MAKMDSSVRRCVIIITFFAMVVSAAPSERDPPGLRIVTRVEWGAQSPKAPATPLKINPPSKVIISHTATSPCKTQVDCTRTIRSIQRYHMDSLAFDDIGYNFLVGGDGFLYEGRGWGVQGAHTKGHNAESIGIAFIGIFDTDEPTAEQLLAAEELIEYGVKIGKISTGYKLLGHRQCVNTVSPGDVLYNIIKSWIHWSPTC